MYQFHQNVFSFGDFEKASPQSDQLRAMWLVIVQSLKPSSR